MTELEETWSPEPVKAWRYWYVGPLEWDFGEHRWKVQIAGDVEVWDSPLKLAGHHLAVQPGTVLEVIDHAAPHTDCRCGINAVKALNFHELQHRTGQVCECYWQQDVMMHGRPFPQVIAVSQVELAGIVDEYEGGYRAQQATIIGPMTVIGGTARIAEVLSENYGIEVRAEAFDGPLSIQLAKEYESGHRQADTPDHRGTGASQDTGAGKRTSKGWRKVGIIALALAMLALILSIKATAGYMLIGTVDFQDEPLDLGDRLLGAGLLILATLQTVWGWDLLKRSWKHIEAQ